MDKGGGGGGKLNFGNLLNKSENAFPNEYNSGVNTYLGQLPNLLGNEMANRTNPNYGDASRIGWQQFLQGQFGPTQYGQQLDALRQLDPSGFALRNQTGNALSADLSKGTGLTPGLQNTIDQGVLRAQAQRGNVYGQAPVEAQAFTEGQAGQNLYEQRLQNALQFQNSATPMQQISQIAPVSADRSMAYTNPNAGYLGVNAVNSNFQNALGLAAANMQPQNNSWMSILGGMGSVAGAIPW